MKYLCALLVLLCLGTATGRAEKLRVSSFSTVLTEVAREVGGDKVEVTGHVKPGMDPHEFEPKASDLRTVSSADLILLSGKQLEGYVGKLREASGARAAILEVGDTFASLPSLEGGGDNWNWIVRGGVTDGVQPNGPRAADPHWWNSVGNIVRATRIVRDKLIRLRPDDDAAFTGKADAYLDKLFVLEKWVKGKVAELPRDRRKLVTNHDSFGYFAMEFGFKVYPIAGFTKNDQPGTRKVAAIVETIRSQGVKAIFSEDVENPKVIEQITRESGAKLGGTLLSDGLGAKPNDTVDAMFHHNITTIVDALK